MVNFNLEGLDELKGITEGSFGGFLATLGVLAVFIVIMVGVAAIILWVFGSIGLMNTAKKNNISNPWLAFLPIGRSYIIGKLGFEIYDSENQNKTTFMWITLGLGAAAFVLGDSNGDLDTLVKYALLFFESWAFYNMFKKLNPKNSVVYTVFTVITGTLLGGVFLYVLKTDEPKKEEVKQPENDLEKKDEDIKKTTKKVPTKTKFCENCGTKLNSSVKFCPECGNKAN